MLRIEERGALLFIEARGAISVEEMEAHFRELQAIAERTTGDVATVIDARTVDLKSLRGAHRDCAVDNLRRLKPLVAHRYVAQAMVLSTAWGRGLTRMLHLFVKPAQHTKAFASVLPAEAWARSHLR